MPKKTPEIKLLTNYTKQYSADSLYTMIESGKAFFNNEIQRALVWNVRQKSLLIHSLIMQYPVPPLYAINTGNNNLDFIDGKQRGMTIWQFKNDRFKLTDIPSVPYTNGEEKDFNGLTFSELPQDIQSAIDQYNVSITIFDKDITKEQTQDVFIRFNNGTQLKRSDRSYAISASKDAIITLSSHELFKKALTKTAQEKLQQRAIIIQSLMLLQDEDYSLQSKDIDEFVKTHEVTEEELTTLSSIYDRLVGIVEDMDKIAAVGTIERRSIKRIAMRNNLPIVVNFLKSHFDDTENAKYFVKFFSGKQRSSVNEEYNDASIAGSGQLKHVVARKRILNEEFGKL